MFVNSTRFGSIEFADDRIITLRGGILGFPEGERYVLHEQSQAQNIAWLQSIDQPELAFPVMDASILGETYPEPSPRTLAEAAGLPNSEDLAVLIVVVPRRTPPTLTANALAPIVIDLTSRIGAQVVLDARQFSATLVLDRAQPSRRESLAKLTSIPAFAAAP